MNRIKLIAWAVLFTLVAIHGRRNVRAPLHAIAQPGESIPALLARGAR